MNDALQAAWKERLRLHVECHKRQAKSRKLSIKSKKLWAEGVECQAKGNTIWYEAVLKERGNISVTWQDGNCTLGTSEVFQRKEDDDEKV